MHLPSVTLTLDWDWIGLDGAATSVAPQLGGLGP